MAQCYPTYYDLNLFVPTYASIINYEDRYVPGFSHSGDIIQSDGDGGPFLMHYLIGRPTVGVGVGFVVFITGYAETPLNKFASQSPPCQLVFDHQAKLVHIVDFPLDHATVGQSHLGVPLIGSRGATEYYFYILPRPECGLKGAAPSYRPDTKRGLRGLCYQYSENMGPPREPKSPPPRVPLIVLPSLHHPPAPRPSVAPHLLSIHMGQDLTSIFPPHQMSHHIDVVSGMTCWLNGELDSRVHTVTPHPPGSTLLPGLLNEPLKGPYILLQGHAILGEGCGPHELEYFQSCTPLVICSDQMTDTARMTVGNKRINGLFIINPSGGSAADRANLDLRRVNKNVVVALAGPQSAIFVRSVFPHKFYFLEGDVTTMITGGLLKEVPAFGDLIELLPEKVKAWALAHVQEDPIIDITTCQVHFQNNQLTLDNILDFFKTATIDDLVSSKSDIQSMFYQMSVLNTNITLKNIGKKIFEEIDRKMFVAPPVEQMRKNIQHQFESLLDGSAAGQAQLFRYRQQKGVYKQKAKLLQYLMQEVSHLISQRDVSSKAMSYKQLRRYNVISSNLDTLEKMTQDDLEELILNECNTLGMFVCGVQAGGKHTVLCTLKTYITNMVQRDRMEESLVRWSMERIMNTGQTTFALSSRQESLDPITAVALLEITAELDCYLAPVDPGITLTMPQSSAGGHSVILIPILDRFINMTDPYNEPWILLCNHPQVAPFLYLLRHVFEKSKFGHRINLNETNRWGEPKYSKDLSWGCVNMLLDIMHQLTSRVSNAAAPPEFDDTLCRQMRCLFGLILTQCAAGQEPISLIWQLWRGPDRRPELPLAWWQWSLYVEMTSYMSFTGWSLLPVKMNALKLVIRVICSKIVRPLKQHLVRRTWAGTKHRILYECDNYKRRLKEDFFPAYCCLTVMVRQLCLDDADPKVADLLMSQLPILTTIFSTFNNRKVRRGGIQQLLLHCALIKQGEIPRRSYLTNLVRTIESKHINKFTITSGATAADIRDVLQRAHESALKTLKQQQVGSSFISRILQHHKHNTLYNNLYWLDPDETPTVTEKHITGLAAQLGMDPRLIIHVCQSFFADAADAAPFEELRKIILQCCASEKEPHDLEMYFVQQMYGGSG